MRWLKYIFMLLGGFVVLCVLLLAIVLIAFDNDDYRRLVTRVVNRSTGYTMTIEGPFALDLSMAPSLSAEAIRFDPGPDKSPPPVRTIGKLRLQIALLPLLRGTLIFKELTAEDVVMAVTIEQEDEPEEQRVSGRKMPTDINIPILENVRLRNIHLDLIDEAANRRLEIRVRWFDIDDRRDAGQLFVKGEGSVSGNEFKIEGQLGALAAIIKGTQPYPVNLNLSTEGFNVSASGTVEDLLDGEGFKLRLSGEAGELSNLFKLLQMEVPPLGHLKFEAAVASDINAPRVSQLNVTLSGEPRVEFTVTGSIDNAISGEGTKIQFSGSCANPEIFKKLLPEDLPVLSRVRLAGEVRETAGALAAENLTIRVDAAQGLSVSADGRIDLGERITTLALKNMDLEIKGSMPTTDLLRPYVIDSLPEMGPLTARARLKGPLERLALEDLVLEAGGSGPLRVTSRGRIGRLTGGDDMNISEIDLHATIKSKNTRLLVSGSRIKVPELGTVSVSTRIRGSSDRFQLAEIDARTATAQELEIALSGSVDFKKSREKGLLGNLDMQARIVAPSVAAAVEPLGVTGLPDLKPLQVDARIGGTTEVLSLRNMALSIGQSRSVRMELKGDIGRIPLAGDELASGVKLEALVSADSAAALATALGGSMPDLGPLKATARLNDRKGTYGLRNLNVVIGDEKNPPLKVTGTVDSVIKAYDVVLDGINLTVAARDLDLQPFSEFLGQSLPDLGPVNGGFQIAGNLAQLAVSRADLTTLSPQGLTIKAAGGIDRIRLKGKKTMKGVDVSLTATAPGLGMLPGMVDLDLPDLGPLQMKASVNDRSGNLDVETFEIQSGSEKQALLRSEGQILNFANLDKIALQATVETASLPWVAKYMHRPEAANYPLAGSIKVTGAAKGVRIDEVRFGTVGGKGLAMQAEGWITDLFESPGMDLKLAAGAPDPSAVGSMLGVSLPPLGPPAINGRIRGNAQKFIFEGETRFGDTSFQSKLSAAFAPERPRIDARFAAKRVNLEEIGIFPGAPQDNSDKAAQTKSSRGRRHFEETPISFDALRAFDVDIALDADKLVGRNIAIKDFDLDIRLENGRLRIHPASMMYAAGFTSFDFILDASRSIPEFSLKITGEDIDIEDVLANAHEPLILSGALNILVDLKSAGRSAREIASNLEGEFAMALEYGRIRRIVNYLSLDAFDMVLNTADRRTHTDLHCLANEILFEEGVGTIEIFYMDTPRIRAKGAGEVNLTAETVDVVLNPEAKRRLLFRRRSALRINGPLTAPAVTILPVPEAAKLYGKILMPYVFLPARGLGYLRSLLVNDKDTTPCIFE